MKIIFFMLTIAMAFKISAPTTSTPMSVQSTKINLARLFRQKKFLSRVLARQEKRIVYTLF